jgi:hypothetical protein
MQDLYIRGVVSRFRYTLYSHGAWFVALNRRGISRNPVPFIAMHKLPYYKVCFRLLYSSSLEDSENLIWEMNFDKVKLV